MSGLLRAVVDAAPVGMVAFDDDGRCLLCNRHATDSLGLEAQTCVGAPIERLLGRLGGVDAAALLARPGTSLADLDGKSVEVTVERLRDGERDAWLVVLRRASEREDRTATAEADREHLLVTLRSIGDGVIVTDAEGRVTMLNPVAEQDTGWTQAEAKGQPSTEVFRTVDEKFRQPQFDPVRHVVSTGKAIGLHDHTLLVARDGTEQPIAHTAAPIVAPDGRIVGAVIVYRDMRSRRQLEQELLRSGRLEGLGTVAGRVAHDFNNALAAILGSLSIAARRVDATHPARGPIDTALAACQRAQDLVRELSAFAKGESISRGEVDVRDAVHLAVNAGLRLGRCQARVEIPGDIWPINADATQARQALQHVLHNAELAMPDGGEILVRARNLDIEEPGSVPLPEGRYVEISVVDHGIGIAERDLPRIFDPFYTTRREAAGLGLAIVHAIVHRHGGYVAIDSRVGRGTKVMLYFPAIGRAVAESPTPFRSAGRPRALVMDDEPLVRSMLEGLLGDLGFEVVTTPDGHRAIDAYREALAGSSRYDLVILDLTVPGGMGGAETIKQLRLLDPGVQAIVSSGYSEDPILSAPEAHGFAGVLTKPYTFDELAERVEQILGRRVDPPS